jgi:hypothetical protein
MAFTVDRGRSPGRGGPQRRLGIVGRGEVSGEHGVTRSEQVLIVAGDPGQQWQGEL